MRQSISKRANHYSSHMAMCLYFGARSMRESLVLLDELGAGGRSQEGASLAIAILEDLHLRGSKPWRPPLSRTRPGIETLGVQNASMEFITDLRPTYRFCKGYQDVPMPLKIASRLVKWLFVKRRVDQSGSGCQPHHWKVELRPRKSPKRLESIRDVEQENLKFFASRRNCIMSWPRRETELNPRRGRSARNCGLALARAIRSYKVSMPNRNSSPMKLLRPSLSWRNY